MRHLASTLIHDTIASFTASASSPHEQLSRLDFVARLALALSAHSAIQHSPVNVGMSTSPGLGWIRQGLEAVRAKCGKAAFASIAQAGIQMLAVRLPVSDPRLKTVEGLRNHLFHGGSLPAEIASSQIATVLSQAIGQAAAKITTDLSGAYLQPLNNTNGPARIELKWNGETYSLSPLLAYSSETNSLLVFKRLTSSALTYTAAKHEPGQRMHRTEDEAFLRRLFRQEPADSFLSDLIQTALEDLIGFIEPGTTVSHIIEDEALLLKWHHADGGSTHPRLDTLRVGPDNAWQWKDGDSWRGYSDFLRTLANWPILKQRLSSILADLVSNASNQDDRLLPLPEGIHPPEMPCSFHVGPMGGPQETYNLEQFANRLTRDVEANRDITYLYFVHAEAGAGKTTALLRMALARAKSSSATLPLFLYVSARGNVLESLDKAIDATVAETRLIYRNSVKALCRQGLLIPIVDGFDELVGSPTYADALASLRPWLRELGGRGVLVVSARSNYFLSLYADSFNKESNRDISVDHRIAELIRWSTEQRDDYLRRCGVSPAHLSELPQDEGELLRLPFFARASIAQLRTGNLADQGGLLPGLIRDYAVREQQKLNVQGTDLISASVIEALFTELAEWMLENNTREVPLSDLKLVAEASMPGGDRPEVQNRLAALCALDVQADDRRFKFSHEVFFDFFFGRFVASVANKPTRLRQVLTRFKLTPSAARIVFGMAHPDDALLASLSNGWETPLPANAGLLWTRMFANAESISDVTIRRVSFGDLDLGYLAIRASSFVGTRFASVVLPQKMPTNLRFINCNIGQLNIPQSCRGISFERCTIGSVRSNTDYNDDPEHIVTLLRQRGAHIIPAFSEASPTESEMPRMARFFLEKIKLRVAKSIVLGGDRLPDDDQSLNWISRHSDVWVRFVQALEKFSLADEETIEAGGTRKSRLRLTFPPDSLLDESSGGEMVKQFWAALKRGDFG